MNSWIDVSHPCGGRNLAPPKGWLKPYQYWDNHLSTGAGFRNHPQYQAENTSPKQGWPLPTTASVPASLKRLKVRRNIAEPRTSGWWFHT